jgi:hypothetical protein
MSSYPVARLVSLSDEGETLTFEKLVSTTISPATHKDVTAQLEISYYPYECHKLSVKLVS